MIVYSQLYYFCKTTGKQVYECLGGDKSIIPEIEKRIAARKQLQKDLKVAERDAAKIVKMLKIAYDI